MHIYYTVIFPKSQCVTHTIAPLGYVARKDFAVNKIHDVPLKLQNESCTKCQLYFMQLLIAVDNTSKNNKAKEGLRKVKIFF